MAMAVSEDDRGAVGQVRLSSRIKAILTVAVPLIGFGAAAAVLRGGRMLPPGSGAKLPVPESFCPVTRRESGFACSGGATRKRARRRRGELGFNVSAAEMVGRMRDEVAAFSCDFARDPPRGSVWPPTEPTILSNVTAGWPASRLSREDFLKHFEGWRLPLSTFLRDCWLALVKQSGQLAEVPEEASFEEYLDLRAATNRNIFVFLRDDSSQSHSNEHQVKKRKFFDETMAQIFAPPTKFETQLRIFAMDGLAAGHGMHCHAEAWLVSLVGRKVWWAAPPSAAHVNTNSDGRPVYPYKSLAPEEGGWPCAWLLDEASAPPGTRRCVQHPGEMVILPARWWHMTCSLDELNMALGGQEA